MIFLVFITVLASKIQSIFVMIFMMDTNLSPSYTPYKTTVACNPTQAVKNIILLHSKKKWLRPSKRNLHAHNSANSFLLK